MPTKFINIYLMRWLTGRLHRRFQLVSRHPLPGIRCRQIHVPTRYSVNRLRAETALPIDADSSWDVRVPRADCGHWLPEAEPDVTASEIFDFVVQHN